MFNKILKEIKTELKEIKTNADIINRIYELIRDTRTQNNTIETLANTNRNQAKIINQLYNEKFGEEDTRFDTVVLIPYRATSLGFLLLLSSFLFKELDYFN